MMVYYSLVVRQWNSQIQFALQKKHLLYSLFANQVHK